MAMYTFYLCKPDGSSNSLEMFELPSDRWAALRATVLLTEHPSCDHVALWREDRQILTRRRRGPPGAGSFRRAPSAASRRTAG